MDFVTSMQHNLTTRTYGEFTGRAGRAEFWWFVLGTALLSAAAGVLDEFWPGDFLETLFNLFIFIPSLALSIRRLHDTNRSGWYLSSC